MMKVKTSIVYITTADTEEARKIGAELIKHRLVSCVNLFNGMESMFHWKGEVRSENEVVMIAKTKSSLIPEVTSLVKELHSYECPCIVSYEISGGNEDFINWIIDETK